MLLAKISGDGRRLIWCTYVGGRGTDWPRGGLALDDEDNVIVVGCGNSADFPAAEGAAGNGPKGPNDAMIVKVRADGSKLLLAALLGGSGREDIMGARVDKAGNLYIAGHTDSSDLPVTSGAPQPRSGGQSDLFLASLSSDAKTIRYCTYLGGDANEFAEHRPALLPDGSLLLTGVTASRGFPTTEGAFQRELKGKNDGFLVKLSPDGRRLAFSTLLGGEGGEFLLMPTVGPDGNIYVVGQTSSKDFPVTEGAIQKTYGGGTSDGVLAVFSPDAKRLVYATYLGGGGEDLVRGLAVGPDGTVYLAGNSSSDDLPFVTRNAAQAKRKGHHDGLILKLSPLKSATVVRP